MINATSNTPSNASSRVEETNDVHNNYCNQEQGRSRKKPRKLKFNLPSTHFCKPVKQILEGELKFWPTCDLNIKECNGGHEIYEMNKDGDLKKWKVQGDNTYWWHDQKSEEEERQKLRIDIKEYDPPMVHVETFEVKKYLFNTGQNFICVTNDLMDALPLGRENESRFKDMISKEVDSGRRIHRKT
ncbi:hypothetical protein Tco_0663181 [Tanacetum coccineum]